MSDDLGLRVSEGRRGFTLIECVASVLIMTLVGMIVGPAVHQTNMKQRGTQSTANLRSMGQGAALYGFFDQGRLFSYSWRAGVRYTMPDGRDRIFDSDQEAADFQLTEILMRRTGRVNGRYKILSNRLRIPHRRYSHVVLIDFLNESIETTKYIDPSDANQLSWHANPLQYWDDDNTLPYGDGPRDYVGYDESAIWSEITTLQSWAFASSYQVVPSAWQPDPPSLRYTPNRNSPHLFSYGATNRNIDLHTGRRISEVVYPSQKVWVFEEFDREQAGSPYFAYDHARSEKLMFDGSVNSWASGDANPSVVPEEGRGPWNQKYVPLHRFPLPLGGLGDETLLNQRFRWTYKGLAGSDYGPLLAPRGPRSMLGD